MAEQSEWVEFCEALDLGRLVPESYRQYQPAVIDGLSYFLENLPEERTEAILADQLTLPPNADVEQRLVALARHCPVLHKLGQILARDHRLPESFRTLLQTLETMPSDLGVEAARALVEAELGPLASRGITIDEPPLAEASVAVVIPFLWHESETEPPRHGVFKLLKAGVEARLEEDLDLLQQIGALLDERCQAYHLPRIEYEQTFMQVRDLLAWEVRLDQEQAHLAAARSLFAGTADVIIPEVHYLSTPRLTAMERVFGRKVTDVASLTAGERRRLATVIVKALIARPLWSNGSATMFHADPHAGNLYVTEDGRIALLDWSLVGYLRKDDQVGLTEILLGAMTLDGERIGRAIAGLADQRIDHAALADAVQTRMQRLRDGTWPGFDWVMGLMDAAATEAGARFDAGLVMFRKVLQTLDGVVKDVSADCRLGRVMALSLTKRLVGEWQRRAYAEPRSRDFSTHFSNLDITQLLVSSPIIGSRYALALQAGLLARDDTRGE
ncbi:MAG: AarF/ABC1/UbiB kinase family protein [Rhodospirillales bacterium]